MMLQMIKKPISTFHFKQEKITASKKLYWYRELNRKLSHRSKKKLVNAQVAVGYGHSIHQAVARVTLKI